MNLVSLEKPSLTRNGLVQPLTRKTPLRPKLYCVSDKNCTETEYLHGLHQPCHRTNDIPTDSAVAPLACRPASCCLCDGLEGCGHNTMVLPAIWAMEQGRKCLWSLVHAPPT
jgi:hypothetical protein